MVTIIKKKVNVERAVGIECTLEDLIKGHETVYFNMILEEGGSYSGSTVDDNIQFFDKTGKKIKASSIKVKIFPDADQIEDSFSGLSD